MDKKLIGGVFNTAEEAEKAIRELQELGDAKDDISVFAKDDDQADKLQDDMDLDVDGDNEGRGKMPVRDLV